MFDAHLQNNNTLNSHRSYISVARPWRNVNVVEFMRHVKRNT